jgi:hypothetical protein
LNIFKAEQFATQFENFSKMILEELRTLTLFNTVESSPNVNQRQLAWMLDVSLGLTNKYFQRVLKKSWANAKTC